jgi:hypothetical protein
MNLLLSRLDEQQRRWYLAVESERMGWGADRQLMGDPMTGQKWVRTVCGGCLTDFQRSATP